MSSLYALVSAINYVIPWGGDYRDPICDRDVRQRAKGGDGGGFKVP